MKKLADSSLRMGDIILTTSSSAASRVIRTATTSDISHAMMYVEYCSVIDASDEGVQAHNTQRIFFENDCTIYVLRLRANLLECQVNDLVAFARSKIGTRYSMGEAIQVVSGRYQKPSNRQFCSRLVAQAFHHIGHDLVVNPDFCSPDELKNSPALLHVKNAVVLATPEEQATFDGLMDTTQVMRDATNAALNAARATNDQIQTFDDLAQHLIDHPSDDEIMCQAIETSGYLSVWHLNMMQSPWQYNLLLMSELPPHEIETYCRAVLSDDKLNRNRYIINRNGYGQLSRRYGLRYYSLMYSLYDHLVSLHGRRVEVASRWLQKALGATPLSRKQLVPHTKEWLSALENWDPDKAAHTRFVIANARCDNVCSICGDDPACDYRIENTHNLEGMVDTFKFCDDCLNIRRASGETLVRLEEASRSQ